jgi:hypothetical protein
MAPGATELANKGMKQTKLAQATELRSLSPVFARLERVLRYGEA